MKRQYLDEIRKLLARYVISREEVDDIVADYDRMYEDGLSRGLDDKGVVEFLGTPEKVVEDLGESYERRPDGKRRNGKYIALMPFLSVIAFFILGFGFGLWHPGWLVFLAIPVAGIVLGEGHGPSMSTLTALSPFMAVVAFILIGWYTGAWHPAWLVFLAIPIFGALSDRKWKGRIFAILLLLSVGAYLYCGYVLDEWQRGVLVFLVPLVYGAAVGAFDTMAELRRLGKLPRSERNFRIAMAAVVIGSVALYAILGFAVGWWAYAWLVFLAIPMAAIIAKAGRANRLVALSPFLATILFFVLGFVFDAWAYAWIAFLMIPMIAIVKNA
jgi:uncharacterized membrane protein